MGGRAPETMQNMGRWGLRDHPIEKCAENPPGADGGQPGYLRLFRRHPIRAFFEHEKAAHFSNEWAFRGRRRSFFHRMGARGNGSVHFLIEWALGGMGPFVFRRIGPAGAGRPHGSASGRTGRPRCHASGGLAAERSRCSARTCRALACVRAEVLGNQLCVVTEPSESTINSNNK